MEKENLNQQELLAKNLVYYRKQSGLTQLELAEKFNYSDKSVSKWERGEGFPDIFVLKSLADFYGITVDDFYLQEHKQISVKGSKSLRKQVYIKLLSLGVAWLVTITTFFFLNTLLKDATFESWLVFIYGVVITGIILLVWDFIYHHRFSRVIDVSIIIWMSALSIYLSVLVMANLNLPLIFIVPIPLQILEIIWFLYRRKKNKAGR